MTKEQAVHLFLDRCFIEAPEARRALEEAKRQLSFLETELKKLGDPPLWRPIQRVTKRLRTTDGERLSEAVCYWEARCEEWDKAERSMLKGEDLTPAIEMIQGMIDSALRLGLSTQALSEGPYPLIPIRDALKS